MLAGGVLSQLELLQIIKARARLGNARSVFEYLDTDTTQRHFIGFTVGRLEREYSNFINKPQMFTLLPRRIVYRSVCAHSPYIPL